MHKPWQHYANRAIQALVYLLFIYVDPFKIGHTNIVAQLVLWPLSAVLIYWCCIREIWPFRVPVPASEPKGSVIVTLTLKRGKFGSKEEQLAVHQLTDQLAAMVVSGDVGDFDGDEFGDGKCMLFMYSHDPEALYQHIEPILRSSPLAAGAIVEISAASGNLLARHALPTLA